MLLRKKSLYVVISTALIIGITIPSTIFIIFQLNETPSVDNPLKLGVDEWLEDFNSFYEFIDGNYPYIWLKNRKKKKYIGEIQRGP